jgi:TonB-linked SusC/RagA family outer membrane protein
MKKNLFKLLLTRAYYLLWMMCLSGPILLASPSEAQELNQIRVTLSLQNTPLPDIFAAIEKQTDFEFSYDKRLGQKGIRLSIIQENETVENVLQYISTHTGLAFKQQGNVIAVNAKNLKSQASTTSSLEIRVRGKITDEQSGDPLPGVNILVKGTTIGAVTDVNGDYSLLIDTENPVLVFSFIGYTTQEIEVGDNPTISVSLAADPRTLQEVVVIGYGEQLRSNVTGASSRVKSEELATYAGSSFANQLSGKAAGVLINEASAQPGTDPQIVIRGIGTLTAGRNPLVVVDGFPLSEGSSLNSINPSDIASVDILKDPASGVIYGSRAANGVILVTTKKATSDKVTVSFDAYTGVQQRGDNVRLPNAYEVAQFFTEARDYGYVSKDPTHRSIDDDRATRVAKGASLRELRLNYLQPYLDGTPGLTDTDWLDEVLRDARMSNYNISFSGRSQKTNYYVSANYFDQEGIVVGTGLKRYSSSVKLDSRLSDRFNFGIGLTPSYQQQQYFENDTDRSGDPLSIALIMYPFFSPHKADGSLAISEQIVANTPEDGALAENPVAIMEKVKSERNNMRVFGNTYLSYALLKGLKVKTLLGGDYRGTFSDYYNPSDVGQYRGAAPKVAVARETDGSILNYLIENTLNYTREFGVHHVDALAGYTFQKEWGNTTLITGSGIPDDNIPNIGGASAYTVNTSRYRWTQISYLARVQYALLNRYLVSVAARRDGSSRFGDDTKWGVFPSVTAGWIVSEETFFPKSNALNFAKLRASWGKAGNNQIGAYGPYSLVSSANYVYGTTLGPGFSASTTSNDNLSWETKVSTDIGIDISFLRSFNLSVDYYSATTEDLLLNVPVPEQAGFSSSLQNIGKVKNSGLEFELGGKDIKLGKVSWSFSGNISANRNEVLALAPGQDQIITGANSAFRTKLGGPIAELYGYNTTGIYKTQEQINSTPHLPGTVVGDYIVEDRTRDGEITLDDKKGFGSYLPKFTYGFSSNFAFKNFDLSFSFTGVEGRKIHDNAIINAENGEGFSVPSQYYFDHRYHPENNPDGFLPQPNMGNFSSARRTTNGSTHYFVSADYLRLRSLQVGYTLPASLLSKVKFTTARIYLSANNLFTITNFRGFNPEATTGYSTGLTNAGINPGTATTTDNVLTSGFSYSNYPIAKSFLVGINLTF